MTDQYRAGDRVQLASLPRGSTRGLRLGQVGTVLVADDQVFAWLTVAFDGHARPRLLRPAHLRLVAAAPAEVAG